MPDNRPVPPLLLQYLFPDSAAAAASAASERLLAWCRAFEDWLAELGRRLKPGTISTTCRDWRRLLRQCPKMPWELEPADLERHVAWMQAQGYSLATLRHALAHISAFFRWCGQHAVDAACGPGFNPAASVRLPDFQAFSATRLLSREEVAALLRAARNDPSPLGKRDYALFLARLGLGVPLRQLRQLKWGQIEQDGPGAWVRWRAGAERFPLDPLLWEAMRDWLQASGRLGGMQAGHYIFTPQVNPSRGWTGRRPQDWQEQRCVMVETLRRSLRLYARMAGLPPIRVNARKLLQTATRLKADQGLTMAELGRFRDSRNKYYQNEGLRDLPDLPPDAGRHLPEPAVPNRITPVLKGGPLNHGFFASRLPQDEIQAVQAQGIQGREQEIGMLAESQDRRLAGLGQVDEERSGPIEAAVSDLAFWMDKMARVQAELEQKAGESPAQRLLKSLEAMRREMGRPDETGGPLLPEPGSTREKPIATLRYLLRRAHRRSMETLDLAEFLRLAALYRRACARLGRLLLADLDSDDPRRQVEEALRTALEELAEEWGLE